MKYITGVFALNIPCQLNTCGDWHIDALDWTKPTIRDSEEGTFGDWGLEGPKKVPYTKTECLVANHLRAILDMMEMNRIPELRGMRHDYICNNEYAPLLMDKVWMLRETPQWGDIDKLMAGEYYMKWERYKNEKEQAASTGN